MTDASVSTMTAQEILDRADLTEQQKANKTAQAFVAAAMGHEVDRVGTIMTEYDNIDRRYASAVSAMQKMRLDISDIEGRLKTSSRVAKEQSDIIDDKATRMGVLAFREILQSTVDVFGMENMTEDVMCKAIEAGSYGMWRSVMGPKDERGAAKRLL